MLMEHIQILQAELAKKQEEARLVAEQLQRSQRRLSAIRGQPYKEPVAEPAIDKKSALKLRLTPEVLDAMDTTAGLPAKGTGKYTGSNASSVSGYSNYSNSNRSAVKRHSHTQLSRVVGRTGEESSRGDASISSCNSMSSERRRSENGLRSKCVQNISNRYTYMPPKYSTSSQGSSFSTKGAVISRAKLSRDSHISIPESPGVGAYDIKTNAHVRGGEIGDSNRLLPWP